MAQLVGPEAARGDDRAPFAGQTTTTVAPEADPKLPKSVQFSLRFIRRLLGGSSGEQLIRALNLSPLRSQFYYALVHLRWDALAHHSPPPFTPYYEFGVGRGATLSRYLDAIESFSRAQASPQVNFPVYLFDSFQGLPEPRGPEDFSSEWRKGSFAHDVAEIREVFRARHIDPDSRNVHFVVGYFEESLTSRIATELKPNPPAIVTIDVDYYSSTKTVLDWLASFLPSGSFLYFDDIYSFYGNPNYGQLKAISDFNRAGKGYLCPAPPFHPLLTGQSFFFVTPKVVWAEGNV